ncbi:hypothetical protein BTUL_0011g00310 [Botrytis tulipae]|uniref:Uncharacterized protein n=1 Tax=Botrytis tulipae TaxID=87230 RepID=A0A4Z1F1G5_9HELO|nr:hypothetical protein BTUL_0011g00310 [Botrytis tulipae]
MPFEYKSQIIVQQLNNSNQFILRFILGSSLVSQVLALQLYNTQQTNGVMGGYLYDYFILVIVLSFKKIRVIVQVTSQSWAMQPSTGQTSATQSYVGQPSSGYTAVHSRGFQSGQRGQGGQDYQPYYDQGSGR